MTQTGNDATSRPPAVPGYTTGRLLGFGGSGEVWAAVEDSTGDAVALKILRVASRDRSAVLRECLVLRRIEHPHVVRLRQVVDLGSSNLSAVPAQQHASDQDDVRRAATGSEDEGVVLVLDHAPGGSLASLVAVRGPLDAGEVATVLTPLARALADLHARGLVHGDVAPGNVLFAADGRPLLSDLGVVSLIGVDSAGERYGTPGYVDPALVTGAAPSPASDVYGLAALGWFALTGRAPAPVRSRPPLIALAPAAPARLVGLIERGLDATPARRPAAAELAAEAFDAAAATPVRLVPTDPGAAAADVVTHRLHLAANEFASQDGGRAAVRHRRRRRRRLAAAVGAAAVLLVAVVVAVTGQLGLSSDAAASPASSAHATTPNEPASVDPGPQVPRWVPPVEVLHALESHDAVDAVEALAGLRAVAFSTGLSEPLGLVNAPESPALASDQAVLASLNDAGVLLEGLSFDVTHAEFVATSPDAAVVRATVVTSQHRRVRAADGVLIDVLPATEPTVSELTLVRNGGRWAVSAVADG